MNLLPKSSREFGSAEYWEKFFQQRGKRAFEWYGSYLELCGVLHKYMKPREKVSAAAGPPCARSVGAEDRPAAGGGRRRAAFRGGRLGPRLRTLGVPRLRGGSERSRARFPGGRPAAPAPA